MKTLAEIVEDYILRYQKEAEKASGKRFDHQRRLQKSALEKACQILLKNVDKIRRPRILTSFIK